MVEFTLSEIVLFIWAVGATVAFFETNKNLRVTKKFIVLILENEDARNALVAEHDKFVAMVDKQPTE